MEAAVALRRSSIQTRRDVVAWTTRLVRGVQRLRHRSTTEAQLSERNIKVLKCLGPFDPFYYWRWMAPIEEPIYVTTSRVKELLTYRSAAYAICSGGEMIKLDVSDDGQRVFVVWETRLVVAPIDDPASSPLEPARFSSSYLGGIDSGNSSFSSLNSSGLNSPTNASANYEPAHINHSAINMLTRTFYFSIRDDGIFYARLTNIEHGIESPNRDYTIIKPLVTRLTHPNLISFNGLAVDSSKYLLFCCCEDAITVWSTYPHQPVLLLQFAMTLFAPINVGIHQAVPYKCALLPDPHCNARACLIVNDKRNSELVKFNLQYYTPILPGPAMSAAVTRSQSLATGGNRIGNVQNPQGICFDASGNLLIADNGNERIQFCVRREDLRREYRGFFEDNDEDSLKADDVIRVRLGLFEQLKTVTPMRTSPFQQGQMIVLAGLGKSFGNTSGGKIICIRCPQQTPSATSSGSAGHSATLPSNFPTTSTTAK